MVYIYLPGHDDDQQEIQSYCPLNIRRKLMQRGTPSALGFQNDCLAFSFFSPRTIWMHIDIRCFCSKRIDTKKQQEWGWASGWQIEA